MRKSMLLTAVLLLMASVGYSQMTTDITETITAKEKEMYEAIKTGDMTTFEANLADEFMSISSTGIFDRAKELEEIRKLKIDSYELSDIRVMQPAESVAIITYTLNGSGTWGEEQFSGTYYSSSTWIMTDDSEWKGVLHTEAQAQPMEETVGMQEME